MKRQHILLLALPASLTLFLLLNIAGSTQSPEAEDSDGDNMPDAYELFFGLNPTNSADVIWDNDGDALANLAESVKLTDPFCEDTDRDGFNDLIDSNAVSRAYIQWGNPQFTIGDEYEYAHPEWLLGAYKNGGEWVATTQVWDVSGCGSNSISIYSGWYVSAGESNDIATLNIDLDRSILTNNLRYAINYLADNNSSLYIDLLDTNGVPIVEDLYGNLLAVSNVAGYACLPCEATSLQGRSGVIPASAAAEPSGEAGEAGLPELGQGIQSTNVVLLLNIPTAQHPAAAVIQLRACHSRESGNPVFVYEGLLYIDEDGDGLDADQERQLGASDYCVDSNGNGTNDYDECFNTGSSTNNPGGGGENGGGEQDPDGSQKPKIIYVDQAKGDDNLTGRAPDVSANKGPKKTVGAGLSAAESADTIIIKTGVYNEDLNIIGKDIKVFIKGNVRL